jgi:hypothetical protein
MDRSRPRRCASASPLPEILPDGRSTLFDLVADAVVERYS